MFVLDPIGLAHGQPAPVIYVARGQVAAGGVPRARARRAPRASSSRTRTRRKEEREAESLIKPPPLARIALKNVALFMEGDLFNSGALIGGARPADRVLHDGAVGADLARPPLDRRARRAPPAVRGAAAPRARVSRERLAWVSGVKQELLDFFVRQGISVSGEMVRVRQLGLCIDCKLCEEACEERYGARRLTLGGYQLGMLDFIYTCRTCTDQRCIDPCAYDSIKFDDERRRRSSSTRRRAPAAPRARRAARTARSTWSRSSPTRRRSRRTSRRGSTRRTRSSSAPAPAASRARAGSRTSAITASRTAIRRACRRARPAR